MEGTGESKPDFSGSWKLVKSENFEEFLAANGANWFVRKMASKSTPQVDIKHEGDNFDIKTITAIRTREDTFKIGTPFSTLGFSGVTSKVTPSWDKNALVMLNEPEAGGKTVIIRREIIDGQLYLTMATGDVVCKRWFDKI